MTSLPPDPGPYSVYGLRIRSEIPLPAPRAAGGHADVEFAWGEAADVPLEPPAGKLLSHRDLGQGRGWSLAETGTGHVLRAHGLFDFRFDRARRHVRVHPAPETDRELAPLFLLGNVAAALIALGGDYPLHASAVATPAGALAILGSVGSGKSTLAALCCAAGAALVTDDLLRLERDGDHFRCPPGPDQLRLRATAAVLAAHFPRTTVGEAADGRITLRLASDRSGPPLRAIVVPKLLRGRNALRLERLAGPQAHFLLTAHARIGSWTAIEPLRAQFSAFAALARAIPVYQAEIPWDPPFSIGMASELLVRVGLASGPRS